jgi:heme exporter protein D
MRWESWSDFWAMGGYALYVWGSVGVTALLMALEVWQARHARQQALQQVREQKALDAWTCDKDTPA